MFRYDWLQIECVQSRSLAGWATLQPPSHTSRDSFPHDQPFATHDGGWSLSRPRREKSDDEPGKHSRDSYTRMGGVIVTSDMSFFMAGCVNARAF